MSCWGAEIKFSSQQEACTFYYLPSVDIEGLRKVFNALEIENNTMLYPYFFGYRKDLESVVCAEEELTQGDPERRCVCRFDWNNEHP